MTLKRVLLTEADHRSTLAAVRGIAREKKGYRVHVAGDSRLNQTFYSRFCSGRHLYQSPIERSEEDFLQSLIDILRNTQFAALLPMGTASAVLISKYKEELSAFTEVVIEGYEEFQQLHNKAACYRICEKIGIPYPQTLEVRSGEDALQAYLELGPQVVLKLLKGAASRGLRYAQSGKQLADFLAEVRSIHEPNKVYDSAHFLVQKRVSGHVHDVLVLCKNGQVRAAMTQRRVKTLPIDGGGGIVNKTTHGYELLREYTAKLMEAVHWTGVAQVEFMVDEETGAVHLIEANPRFWGTTALSIVAGINFPRLALEMALNGDIEPCFTYAHDYTYRWLFPDELFWMMQNRQRHQHLKDFLRWPGRNTTTNIVLSDLGPTVMIGVDAIWRLVRGQLRIAALERKQA